MGDKLTNVSDLVSGEQLVARFRAIRKARRISAQTISDATGISRSVLAKIEMGRRSPYSYEEARLIAGALDVDLRQAITDEPMVISTDVKVV